MSEEQTASAELEEPEKIQKQGKVGRTFVTLIVLILAIGTAVLAYLKDSEWIQGLLTSDEWVSRLIGNLHPVLMLIPIGLILLVVLVEILGWFSFGKWKPVTLFALFLSVITSIFAALSGLVLMKLEGNSGPEWTQYMWYGIGVMGALTLSFLCKIWGKNGNGRGFLYAIFLLGGAAALGYGGYTYGQKVHGYSLIPSTDDIASPFQNKIAMEKMSASIAELEASGEQMKTEISTKEQKITELSEVQKKTETNYRSELQQRTTAEKSNKDLKTQIQAAQTKISAAEKKAAQAEKKAADIQKKFVAAQKSVAEAQKQNAEGKKRENKLQQQLQGLKTQMEALKQEKANALKKQAQLTKEAQALRSAAENAKKAVEKKVEEATKDQKKAE